MSPVESMFSVFYTWDFLKYIVYPVLFGFAILLIKFIGKKTYEKLKLNRMAKYGMDYIEKMDGFSLKCILKHFFRNWVTSLRLQERQEIMELTWS